MSKRKHKNKPVTAKIATDHLKKNQPSAEPAAWNRMTNWFVILVVILPVIFSWQTIDPAIVPRHILLGVFLFLLILFFIRKRERFEFGWTPWLKMVFALGIGFAVWSLVSLAGAINPGAGYYEVARNFLNIILLFVIMVMVKNELSSVLKLCKAISIVSIIVSFTGICQYYGIAFTDLPGNFKPYGLMANRNLFGSVQVLFFPFILYSLSRSAGVWKWISALAVMGLLTSLIISQTRSAWLAAVVFLVISFILIMFFSKTNLKKWATGYAAGVLSVTILVFILMKTDTGNSLTESLKERATSITNPGASTTGQGAENIRDRIKIWEKTLQVIKDRPVSGVGFSNWKLTVLGYGGDGMSWEAGYYVPDRPHNVYLQVAAETGVPGFILYFGMWLMIGITGLKTIIRVKEDNHRILLILMLGGLAAFASDNMFSFANERIEHTLLISLMGGTILGSYLLVKQKENPGKSPISKNWSLVAAAIVLLNIYIGYTKYNFEVHANLSKAYLDAGNPARAIEEAGFAKNSWVTVDPEGIPVEVYSMVAYKNLKDFNNAMKEGLLAKKYNPNSMMTINNLGTIYTELGQYETAIEYYLHARKMTPRSEIVLKNLSYNYYQTGKYRECIEALQHVNVQGDEFLVNMLQDATKRAAAGQ